VPLGDGAFRAGALAAENVASRSEDNTGPALHVKDAARPGVLELRMPSSYVYLGGRIALEAAIAAPRRGVATGGSAVPASRRDPLSAGYFACSPTGT